MKTTKEHFATLPSDIRGRAIKNTEDFLPKLLDRPCPSLKSALIASFVWKLTEEGSQFWKQVIDQNESN